MADLPHHTSGATTDARNVLEARWRSAPSRGIDLLVSVSGNGSSAVVWVLAAHNSNVIFVVSLPAVIGRLPSPTRLRCTMFIWSPMLSCVSASRKSNSVLERGAHFGFCGLDSTGWSALKRRTIPHTAPFATNADPSSPSPNDVGMVDMELLRLTRTDSVRPICCLWWDARRAGSAENTWDKSLVSS